LRAARVAARLEKELGIPVKRLSGHYGEFTVLVGDEVVLSGGRFGWMGMLPSYCHVRDKVRARLGLRS
jgi:hypothetical protein